MNTEIDNNGGMPAQVNKQKVTQQSLDGILQRHSDWLMDSPNGARAELSFLTLSGLDFSGRSLDGASFYMSDLQNCNFQRASLVSTSFMKARCASSDFSGAMLRGAAFSYADLTDCNFFEADLRNCQGNRREIKSFMVVDGWPITYTSHKVYVGCISMTYDELDSYNGLTDLDDLMLKYGEGINDPGLRLILETIVAVPGVCDSIPSRNEDTYLKE